MRVDPRIAAGIAGILTAAGASDAAVILQAGGWQIEVDDSVRGDVRLTAVFNSQTGTLSLVKVANFTSVNGLTGFPDSIVLTWTQIADDANTASRIIIDAELVTNNTGVAWGEFEMALLDSGDATFNQALSSGFVATPFTTQAYSADSTMVTFAGGTVDAGADWRPGLTSGDLVIDLDLSRANPMTFNFKELPLIPAPGIGAAAAFGALLVARRRR